ncbi:chemotaxis-specific protein-glutamate methyltransferase CheB [uncultured Erythrobacter sp.]|uniref:chemotaxis-specific protein-glutamate methyltransferase CheB n=1 Tax=uncultured Erythrobacter sp. TaxID=263913 RepID=UPI0026240F54|nr:chemotaxis-specific protein-glutamate methyltransferase CheB [uncultured Erythrobacter sp.]
MTTSTRLRTGAQPLRPADAIRVMLIDDSLTVRTIFKRMIESDPQMEIAGTASSAERGIAQLADADADVVLLDLEMPGMGGLEALPQILRAAPSAQVMVVSSLTDDGAEATIEALSRGAADTMLKPRPGGFNDEYRSLLLDKVRALGTQNNAGDAEPANTSSGAARVAAVPQQHRRTKHPEVLAIGASTGGIHALNILLRQLPKEFDLPILITQHLPSSFIPVFARQIEVASGRTTRIAEDGTEIDRGEIAIATGHGHMIVRRVGDSLVTRISADPSISGCLPSVDPMLSSLTEACNGHAIAVILSGMGRDGFDGASALSAAGGTIWAQDADTSAVWGMPGAVTKGGLTSYVASPEALGAAMVSEFIKSWKPARDQASS